MLSARGIHPVSQPGEARNLLKRIEQTEREQAADAARIDGAIARAESEIAALEGQLASTELQKAITAIRDRAIMTIRDVRHNMQKRIGAAENIQAVLSKDFLRPSLRFAKDDAEDVNLRKRFFDLLARSPTAALVDHFQDAIGAGDIACAESIRFEFHCRADRQEYDERFDAMVAKTVLHIPVEIQKRLANIRNSADQVDARVTDLLRRAHSIHPIDEPTEI
jgi:hypothetical protein